MNHEELVTVTVTVTVRWLVTSKAKHDARPVAAGAATGQGDLAGFNRTGKVIGLWENLQESPIFDGKIHGFL